MIDPAKTLRSLEGVCELSVHQPAGPPRGWLFIEVPHGATRRSDYDAVATRMKSPLPDQLEHFFFVNTDIGAPEGATFIAKTLAAKGHGVVVARCLIPRTFIDTNRVIAATPNGTVTAGLTSAMPSYVTDAQDAAWLEAQHSAYHSLVKRAYDLICGEAKGLALQLHSFAPRSVDIQKTDAGIVEALHQAYVPEVYAKWPERPAIDVISALADGSFRTAPRLVNGVRAAFAKAGIQALENATYHLHPITMGYVYAHAFADQVLCVELNRGLVSNPFVPFGVSPLSAEKIATLCTPIAETLSAELTAINA